MRNIPKVFLLVVALLVAGCQSCNPTPPTPAPVNPPQPPPPLLVDAGKPGCATACANLEKLECPEWSVMCVTDCSTLDAKLESLGSPGVDHACVAAATSCELAKFCR